MRVPGLHKLQICEKSPVNTCTYTIIKHIQSSFTQKSSNMQKKVANFTCECKHNVHLGE